MPAIETSGGESLICRYAALAEPTLTSGMVNVPDGNSPQTTLQSTPDSGYGRPEDKEKRHFWMQLAAAAPIQFRQKSASQLMWVLPALLLLALPILLLASPIGSLDLIGDGEPAARANPVEIPGNSWPGSAFFYAEGAFDAAPGAPDSSVDNPHVLALAKVSAMPTTLFRGTTGLDAYRALNCLTSAIYYEAGNEPDDGQRAVAQVVLNRVRHPAWPNTVCGVVYEGSERTDMRCQFTFSCDGAMARIPNRQSWARARSVAQQALNGSVYAPVGSATHYHTLAVSPDWSSSLTPVAVVGAHIFYRWRGAQGEPKAFYAYYSGRELISGPTPGVWKPKSAPLPYAMPLAPPVLPGTPIAPSAPAGSGWQPFQPPQPARDPGSALPDSNIRPEYRDSGKPLI